MGKPRGFPPSRVSFPVSPRLARIGFHRPWSYSLSAGFKYRQPDGMYVPSSVDITIMMNATFRARPFTDIKRQGVENMPTLEAAFRRRVPLVDFDADNPACGRWCFIPIAKARGPHTTF